MGGLVYLWSTCGPMELGPAFSKVLTIKGGGHRVGCQKGGGQGVEHRATDRDRLAPVTPEGKKEDRSRLVGDKSSKSYDP